MIKSSSSPNDLRRRAESVAGPLPPLLVAAQRVAATVEQGVHGRRRVGSGDSFWQFRRYQPGESATAIDWRQSAKGDPLYVRETEWAAAQTVWLWVDCSASMAFRSPTIAENKGERAALLALALAVLLVRAGERVALLGGGDRPAGGKAALERLALALSTDRTGSEPEPAAAAVARHGRVVLIGDFLTEPAQVRARVAAFVARGVRGHLLQVLDPAEETLPFAGRVVFEDAESHERLPVERVETLRGAYLNRLAAHRVALQDLACAAGWGFTGHRTDHPPHPALLALHEAFGR
ncbi:DUF58 domain-containing protein [uncultured Gammaproteobacteria bacterium]